MSNVVRIAHEEDDELIVNWYKTPRTPLHKRDLPLKVEQLLLKYSFVQGEIRKSGLRSGRPCKNFCT